MEARIWRILRPAAPKQACIYNMRLLWPTTLQSPSIPLVAENPRSPTRGNRTRATQRTRHSLIKSTTSPASLPDSELESVLMTSYGEIEQSVPPSYARSVCNFFAQLGARGVSVIYSSGDSGVGESFLSNDGKGRTKFQPICPASCPFVTAVGGVEGINPETAIDFFSGGFS